MLWERTCRQNRKHQSSIGYLVGRKKNRIGVNERQKNIWIFFCSSKRHKNKIESMATQRDNVMMMKKEKNIISPTFFIFFLETTCLQRIATATKKKNLWLKPSFFFDSENTRTCDIFNLLTSRHFYSCSGNYSVWLTFWPYFCFSHSIYGLSTDYIACTLIVVIYLHRIELLWWLSNIHKRCRLRRFESNHFFQTNFCRNNNDISDKRCACDRQHKAANIGLFFFLYLCCQIKICIKIEQKMKNQ